MDGFIEGFMGGVIAFIELIGGFIGVIEDEM